MVALLPATFDRLQIRVAVVLDEVLKEMLLNAKNQGATLPLDRGQTKPHITQRNGKKATVRRLKLPVCLQFLPSSGSFSSS